MQGPSSRAVDVVGLFDEGFKQLAAGARPLKAEVREEARLMDHPLESGATITDHRVIQPIEINLVMLLLNPADDYAQLKAIYLAGDLVTVQTRTGSYPNMLIAALPHEETIEAYDRAPLTLGLRQVVLVEAQFQALPARQVEQPRNASTSKRGQKTTSPEGTDAEGKKKSSTLYRIFNP